MSTIRADKDGAVPIPQHEQPCKCSHHHSDHKSKDGACDFCICPKYDAVGAKWYPARQAHSDKLHAALLSVIENMKKLPEKECQGIELRFVDGPSDSVKIRHEWSVLVINRGYKRSAPYDSEYYRDDEGDDDE